MTGNIRHKFSKLRQQTVTFYTACAALPVSLSATKAIQVATAQVFLLASQWMILRSESNEWSSEGLCQSDVVVAAVVSPAGRGRGLDPDGRGRTSGGVGRGFVSVNNRQCFGCGKIGHIAKDCPEIK